ncbi:hypothetical protein L596_001706 [Steinernema carpocapsae]|uniref:Uncharacterized protein n=1 Tax=Steinernema carpocapsae TaxID=34508 RepID=A0A4U8UMB1_STECR|nr:hypothetical protein L596_001706 [Steinernema carpocapsae]
MSEEAKNGSLHFNENLQYLRIPSVKFGRVETGIAKIQSSENLKIEFKAEEGSTHASSPFRWCAHECARLKKQLFQLVQLIRVQIRLGHEHLHDDLAVFIRPPTIRLY